MKTLLSLRLVVAALLAGPLVLPAQEVPKRISQPAPAKPTETAEQKAARHDRELKEAEAKVNALVKDFPLLTAPGWEENYAKFRTELAIVQTQPEFKRRPLVERIKMESGKPPVPKTLAEMQAEERDATLKMMRQMADRVVEKRPELGDFALQSLQWHHRIFELVSRHPDNPKVRELGQRRLDRGSPSSERK